MCYVTFEWPHNGHYNVLKYCSMLQWMLPCYIRKTPSFLQCYRRSITEVLACHCATNCVRAKLNMAAAIHYEQLISLLSKVSCKCDTSNLTDLGTLNSFLILYLNIPGHLDLQMTRSRSFGHKVSLG